MAPKAEPKKVTAKDRQRLNNKALVALREQHPGDFDKHATSIYAEEGFTYERALSKAERAQKKIEEIAAAAGITVTVGQSGETVTEPADTLDIDDAAASARA